MWEDFLVREAKRRRKVFANISTYLSKIKGIVNKIDPNGKVFLFGSTARREHTLSSDIDILIVTEAHPSIIISSLWREGLDEPFEFHVISNEQFKTYRLLIQDINEI